MSLNDASAHFHGLVEWREENLLVCLGKNLENKIHLIFSKLLYIVDSSILDVKSLLRLKTRPNGLTMRWIALLASNLPIVF